MAEDFEIIKGCKANDSNCQRQLLESYSGYLAAIIKRYYPYSDNFQDVLQETWIQIFKNIGKYKEEGKLKAWLTQIAISQCFRELRKSKRIQYVDKLPDKQYCKEVAVSALNYKDLMMMVNQLKNPGRNVFVMHIIDGLSHKEIAEILQIKESTSRVHLTNARKKLKEILKMTSAISL